MGIPERTRPPRTLLSRKLGVVARVGIHERAGGDFEAHHVWSQSAKYNRIPGGGDVDGTGGSFYDLAGAYDRGVFECIERYCASFSDVNGLRFGPPGSADSFLYGERLPLYADFQYASAGFPFQPLTSRSRIFWREGRSLVSGRAWYVPACVVGVPYFPQTPDENIGPTTSVGMAAGSSWATACLSGLFEVIEREAFNVMWLNRLALPRLRPAPGSTLAGALTRLLDGDDARLTFVDLTTDFAVPVVLALLERRLFGRPLVTMGASAKPTHGDAAAKAALEAFACYHRVRQEYEDPRLPGWRCRPDFSDVDDYIKHCLVYADPALHHHLDFITSSPIERVIDADAPAMARSPEELLLQYARRVEGVGEDAIAVTLTTPEIAAEGLHVVKLMVPGAVPLNPDHRYPPLGHRRLYALPRALGHRTHELRPDELNLAVPHPFP